MPLAGRRANCVDSHSWTGWALMGALRYENGLSMHGAFLI
jgi:hypothetical protein